MELSYVQQQVMEKELQIAAADYAKILSERLKDALASNNTNLLMREKDASENIMTTTFFYEKQVYIDAHILELAKTILEIEEDLEYYDGMEEDLLSFEQYVSDNLPGLWVFEYGDNGDTYATLMEEIDHG